MSDQNTPAAQPVTPPAALAAVPSTSPAQQGGGQAPPPGGQAAPEAGRSAAEQQTADVAQQVLEGTIDLEKDGDRVVEVIVDGQVRRYKLKDAVKKISLGEAGYQRMEEGAKLKKEAQEATKSLLAALQDLDGDDPDRFAASIAVVSRARQKAGLKPIDFRSVAEGYLAKVAELEAMDPAQRRVRELEMENERLRQAHLQREKDAEDRQRQAEREEDNQVADRAAKKFNEDTRRLFETRRMPHSYAMKARAAGILLDNMDRGVDKEIDDVTEEVETEFVADVRVYVGARDGKELADLLGPETVEKVRKYLVEQATRGGTPRGTVPAVGTPPPQNGAKPAQPQRGFYESGDVEGWRRARGG